MSTLRMLAVPVLVLTLAACSMIEEHETTAQVVDDKTITTQIEEAFVGDNQIHVMQINVSTTQGVVQLSGFVDSTASEQRAVYLASHINGVKSVKDNIQIRGAKTAATPTTK